MAKCGLDIYFKPIINEGHTHLLDALKHHDLISAPDRHGFYRYVPSEVCALVTGESEVKRACGNIAYFIPNIACRGFAIYIDEYGSHYYYQVYFENRKEILYGKYRSIVSVEQRLALSADELNVWTPVVDDGYIVGKEKRLANTKRLTIGRLVYDLNVPETKKDWYDFELDPKKPDSSTGSSTEWANDALPF